MSIVHKANAIVGTFARMQKIINQDQDAYMLVNRKTKVYYEKHYAEIDGKYKLWGYNIYGKNPDEERISLGTYDSAKEARFEVKRLKRAIKLGCTAEAAIY